MVDADTVTAWATVGGTALVGVSAVLAAIALRRQSRDVEAATRPVLVAELRVNHMVSAGADLRLTNYGASPAYDVTVTLSPQPFVLDDGRQSEFPNIIVERYAEVIPVLPQHVTLSNTYFLLDPKTGRNAYALHDTFSVEVKYVSGRGRRDRSYSETFALDMRHIQFETTAGLSDSMPDSRRTAVALEALARGRSKL